MNIVPLSGISINKHSETIQASTNIEAISGWFKGEVMKEFAFATKKDSKETLMKKSLRPIKNVRIPRLKSSKKEKSF